MHKIEKNRHTCSSRVEPYRENSKGQIWKETSSEVKGPVSFTHGSRLRMNKHMVQVAPLPIRRCLPPPLSLPYEDDFQGKSDSVQKLPVFPFALERGKYEGKCSDCVDDSITNSAFVPVKSERDQVSVKDSYSDNEIEGNNDSESILDIYNDEQSIISQSKKNDVEEIEYDNNSYSSKSDCVSSDREEYKLQQLFAAKKGTRVLDYEDELSKSNASAESDYESNSNISAESDYESVIGSVDDDASEVEKRKFLLDNLKGLSESERSDISSHQGRGVDLLLDATSHCESDDEDEIESNGALVKSNESSNDALQSSVEDEDDDSISSCEEHFERETSFLIESDDLQKTLHDIEEDQSQDSLYYDESVTSSYSDCDNECDYHTMDSEFEKSLYNNGQIEQYVHPSHQENKMANGLSCLDLKQFTSNYDDEQLKKSPCCADVKSCVTSSLRHVSVERDIENVSSDNIDGGNNISESETLRTISEYLDFDYWSHEILLIIASHLRRKLYSMDETSCLSHSRLPPENDEDFWVNEILSLIDFDSLCLDSVTYLPMRSIVAKMVHDAFATELKPLDVSLVPYKNDSNEDINILSNTNIARECYIGSLSSVESRLALALLNIKHIFVIDSYPPDELWVDDGIRYNTHVLPSSDDANPKVCDIIEACALEVVTLLFEYELTEDSIESREGSILIACKTGNEYACAVAATVLTKAFNIDMASAMKIMRQCRPDIQVEPSWLPPTWLFTGSPDTAVLSPRTKRILSFPKISSLLNLKDIPECHDSPKRARCENGSDDFMIPSLSLGEAAIATLPSFCSVLSDKKSNDDGKSDFAGNNILKDYPQSESSSFVPLLTPPVTPKHEQESFGHDKSSDSLLISSESTLQKYKCLTLTAPSLCEEKGADQNQTGLTPRLSSLNFDYL